MDYIKMIESTQLFCPWNCPKVVSWTICSQFM